MKSYFFIAGILLLAACSSPKSEQQSVGGNETESNKPVEVRNLLQEFKEYVELLDSTDEKSMSLATEKYTGLFAKSDPRVCDSAFIVLNRLYDKLENNLNERVMNDPFLSGLPCVSLDSLGGKEKPYEKKYLPFKKSLDKNGFRINCPEGMTGIGQNRSFLSKQVYPHVSPLMKQFLEALRKESDESFSEDAGIIISPEEHIDRLVWWERFNEANPDFILSRKAKSYQIYLFHFLLTGMDNTPLLNNEFDEEGQSNMELDAYFTEAYAYLNKKYPRSQTNLLVKPYASAIRKNDRARSEKLLHTYTKRGLMIDFEKGYDLDL